MPRILARRRPHCNRRCSCSSSSARPTPPRSISSSPAAPTTNPWSQAFVWAREHTPNDALFALDANYITTDGEDGQTFRATARRSALPDFSKDGGEAAVRPSLAPEWYAGQAAQKDLSTLTDAQRNQRLRPLGVTWLILHATAPTAVACPYTNAVVKVCPE